MENLKHDAQSGTGFAHKGGAGQCALCEAMLTDVLDGTLPEEEQARFDQHVASCAACSAMLGDARRGAAWLELLRTPRPEPPAALLERILAQTSAHAAMPEPGVATGAFAGSSVLPVEGVTARTGMVLPFRSRWNAAIHRSAVGHAVLQPRLAMTAAMAFFSIGLTLNLTGVRLNELKPSDLKPANLRRSLYQADAHLVRYYDNLRVVYELESRVRDLQRATEGESERAPNSEGDPGATKPADSHPSAPKVPEKQTGPNGPGTSRRQGQPEVRSLAVLLVGGRSSATQAVVDARPACLPSGESAPAGGLV